MTKELGNLWIGYYFLSKDSIVKILNKILEENAKTSGNFTRTKFL